MKILSKTMLSIPNKSYRLTRSLTALLASVLFCLPAIAAPEDTRGQALDQVIAIVDDDVVLASELQERVQQVVANIEKQEKEAPPIAEIRQSLLDQLILENIQMQSAVRAGVRISDAQLNDAMLRIAQQNQLTLDQFRQALDADGLSYAGTREQIRKEMMLQRVQQGNVNQRVQITDQEITNFLDSEEGAALTAPDFRMSHTLIPLPSGASSDDIASAKALADKFYQRIQQGESYETVFANTQFASSDLGWRKASDLPSLISALPLAMSKGETAEPVQSPSGFHMVKLADTRGEGELIPQTKVRHILLKSSAIRDEVATEALARSLRQKIIDGADFGELAREYSEDIGSALEGGDLGWSSPGQLVGEFQTTMDLTEIDQVSDPFTSQFGWHILQVLERRDKDVTDDIRRNIARNYLHKRKYGDELETWLQKIRDEAYVDFK
ncbi:MAG: peptidylprolyl isomerase [Oceanicoccus sp.]